jgi:hypothetical protein
LFEQCWQGVEREFCTLSDRKANIDKLKNYNDERLLLSLHQRIILKSFFTLVPLKEKDANTIKTGVGYAGGMATATTRQPVAATTITEQQPEFDKEFFSCF